MQHVIRPVIRRAGAAGQRLCFPAIFVAMAKLLTSSAVRRRGRRRRFRRSVVGNARAAPVRCGQCAPATHRCRRSRSREDQRSATGITCSSRRRHHPARHVGGWRRRQFCGVVIFLLLPGYSQMMLPDSSTRVSSPASSVPPCSGGIDCSPERLGQHRGDRRPARIRFCCLFCCVSDASAQARDQPPVASSAARVRGPESCRRSRREVRVAAQMRHQDVASSRPGMVARARLPYPGSRRLDVAARRRALAQRRIDLGRDDHEHGGRRPAGNSSVHDIGDEGAASGTVGQAANGRSSMHRGRRCRRFRRRFR